VCELPAGAIAFPQMAQFAKTTLVDGSLASLFALHRKSIVLRLTISAGKII
jgi:hypothetical protein